MNTNQGQHWVMLGTAPASEELWGLKPITFPCGYYMPALAYVAPGGSLSVPTGVGEVWGMGGFAFEVGEGGKDIPLAEAHRHVAGYRPWLAVFHDCLLDELRVREHTVMVWDRGVSIFYGLWREGCQSLGELISLESFSAVTDVTAELIIGGARYTGSAARKYAHDAAAVIHFMSQFMTLSPGDVYVLGPLVAGCVKLGGASELVLSVGDLRHAAQAA